MNKNFDNDNILQIIERADTFSATSDILMKGLEKQCEKARKRHREVSTFRRGAVSVVSLAVIAFCVIYNFHNDGRCGYCVDNQILYSRLQIDNIDNLFNA